MYRKLGYLSWDGSILWEILDENGDCIADELSLSLANRILIVLNGED